MNSRGGAPRLAGLLAAAYLAAHLPLLAPSLEDIDSINFALGLREFDVASHQPHPPGYPVYIALGRVSLALVSAIAPALDAARAEALALSVWSAVAGALALVAAWAFYAALGSSRRTALWATALLAVAPLFWLAGLRPMSDLPGLALAMCAQALLLRGMGDRRHLIAGALLAGIAAGVRVQMLLLTAPLLLLVLLLARAREGGGAVHGGGAWRIAQCALALTAGVLVWAVPLVAPTGVDGYARALAVQAGEDFAWVDMLWANPTPRRLALSVYETLVLPWSMTALAVVVGVSAAAGGVSAIVREPRALALTTTAFGPYVLFHLVFQETFTVRYALPVLPAVAWLAARGAMTAGRGGAVVAAVLVGWAAIVAVPAGVAYGREAHPAFRAIADMDEQARAASRTSEGAASVPAAVFSHYVLRRPLQARAPAGVRVVEPPPQGEWLAMADYWRSGNTAPVWFLADPRRTDLESIDPQARQPARYRWRVGGRPEFRGTRPLGADWYRFDPPGWFVGEGWSLTPETGGVTRASGTGLDRQPITAFVRRRGDPMHMMIGGGYVDTNLVRGPGGANQPAGGATEAVELTLSIDETTVATWTLAPGGDGRFLRFIDLPDGVASEGASGYATLTVAARAAMPRQPAVAVAIRQFDIQPASRMIAAFGEGWHDAEYDNLTGLRWRWTSDRSVIRVWPSQSVRLRIRGESPARYFDAPPRVRISANAKIVAAFEPLDDFVWEVVVPAEDVAAADGAIAIETDRVYLPAESEGTDDPRRLGLRLFDIDVHPVSP